jgi:hypothetical protein
MEKIEGVHCLFALAALTQFAILVATPIRPFWMASQLAFVSAGRILAFWHVFAARRCSK